MKERYLDFLALRYMDTVANWLTRTSLLSSLREGEADEAICLRVFNRPDCFASLAMTVSSQTSSADLLQSPKMAEERRQVAIPAVSLAESLVKTADSKCKMLSAITRNIRALPFDSKAALIYGEIRDQWAPKFKGAHDRRSVKVDLMVLAIAISNEAESLITHDTAIVGETIRGVKVTEIPAFPFQLRIPESQ